MWTIVRSILAVIAGFVAASAVMMLIETVNGRVLYPALGKQAEGVTDREAIRAVMANAPVGAFLVVLLGWALGGSCGWIPRRVDRLERSSSSRADAWRVAHAGRCCQ